MPEGAAQLYGKGDAGPGGAMATLEGQAGDRRHRRPGRPSPPCVSAQHCPGLSLRPRGRYPVGGHELSIPRKEQRVKRAAEDILFLGFSGKQKR